MQGSLLHFICYLNCSIFRLSQGKIKGYIIAVAGLCGDARELGRHTGIFLTCSGSVVGSQPSLVLKTPCGAWEIEWTPML